METEQQDQFELIWKQIEESFNWQKVYRAMISAEWNWHFVDEKYGIPSIPTIKRSARELLNEAYESGGGIFSSGGFTAGICAGELYLSFVLENSSAKLD